MRQALIEKRSREESTNRDILIVVKAKERTAVQNEIATLETDPTFVKAGQRLKTAERPVFLKIGGLGGIVATNTRKDADYIMLGGQRLGIDQFDSVVKEEAINKRIVEGYEARLAALKGKLSKLESELSSL